jgi:hypothetical protein
VKRRGSRILMPSSVDTSRDDRLDPLSPFSGGGDELFPGGVTDRRDFLEFRDGVLYGVSFGVGSDATKGALDSSSVSQTTMVQYPEHGRPDARQRMDKRQ